MGLFGKNKMTESEVARAFVVGLMESVQQHWPDISRDLKAVSDLASLDDPEASFEFFIAVMATQLQGLQNFLKADQANRIEQHLIRCISAPGLDSYPKDTIQEYRRAWDRTASNGRDPIDGITSLLCDKLGYGSEGGHDNTTILMIVLTQYIVTFCYFKNMIQEYKLVS
ncbi:hypothetical protein [Nitrosomonas sp.]|uniref:hypothetical protein n=1 Tax=Nitrosomonas sp. TaxID=42353 RepID=UPI002730BBF4|nr:hypothetical protein [Nitrosomonas sp.]MDP1788615.1 hypothetical protein [Nitrosomonas sp.]